MKRLSVGILAHVDAGKTTLSEAMLYHAGEIRKIGRVDHGDAFLDTDAIEKSRGITIFSKQAVFHWKDSSVTLLDTPGHVDFSAEMERTLSVLDYAVLVISASDGVQSHTETLWKLLKRYEVPTFLFVNKMDLALRKDYEILESMAERLGPGLVSFGTKSLDQFYEDMSLYSEDLTEQLLEEGELTDPQIAGAIGRREVFPVFFGSALKDQGVEELLDGMDRYMAVGALAGQTAGGKPGANGAKAGAAEPFGARAFKVARDENGERLVFAKITSGSIAVKEKIGEEKINQIRVYSGQQYRLVEVAETGMVVAFTGLTEVGSGDGLGCAEDAAEEVLEPFMNYQVLLPDGVDSFKALGDFRQLAEEDPKLHVKWNEGNGMIELALMGRVQLEIIRQMASQRFGYDVEFGQGRVVYKETLDPDAGPVEGIGHFEPLRHYAEVHLILEAGERGSGMVFDSCVSEDVLDRNWQRLILTHLLEREHPGVLTGAPITDMKITIAAGRAHKKHTEGGDFRQSTYRAIRCGLMRGQCILLEPWFRFTITVPSEQIGRVMADVQKMKGEFEQPETKGEFTEISGRAPAVEMKDYPVQLASFTGGRGRMTCTLAGYDRCHNQEEVLVACDYDPERDTDNPADSVFCSHGSGDIVSWREIEEHMHLPLALVEEVDLDDEESVSARARRYAQQTASDAELMAIFERTYGATNRNRKNHVVRRRKPAESESSNVGWTAPKGKMRKTGDGKIYMLIDGYNLIHAWDELEEMANSDFGAARESLIDILCNYQGFTGHNVIVVFDAYKVKGGVGSQERVRNIDVVYTKEAETADMYIEKVTHEIGQKHDVRVVTSDGLEQLIIMGHGALRISSREFVAEVRMIEDAIYDVIQGY